MGGALFAVVSVLVPALTLLVFFDLRAGFLRFFSFFASLLKKYHHNSKGGGKKGDRQKQNNKARTRASSLAWHHEPRDDEETSGAKKHQIRHAGKELAWETEREHKESPTTNLTRFSFRGGGVRNTRKRSLLCVSGWRQRMA